MEVGDDTIGVIHVGLGQIGAAIARLVASKPHLRSVGAVDPNPECAHRRLSDVCGSDLADVVVRPSLAEAMADAAERGGARVAFHAVASHVPAIAPQLAEIGRAGLDVVTTAEELIHPYDRYPRETAEIDAEARRNGVTIYAAGVNPGVLMDRLPTYLSSLCTRVDAVRVTRLVNLGKRRPALRRKMGVGQPEADVRRRIAEKTIGHVGLVESLQYMASAFGWQLGPIDEHLEPLVAGTRVEKAGERVDSGQVLGLHHVARARTKDGRELELDLTMRLDTDAPFDEIEISGAPPIHVRFPEGVAGDEATAATVVNAARFVVAAGPGLVAHLPTPSGS